MRDWTDFEDEEVEVLEYGGGKAVLAKCDTVNTGPCTPHGHTPMGHNT